MQGKRKVDAAASVTDFTSTDSIAELRPGISSRGADARASKDAVVPRQPLSAVRFAVPPAVTFAKLPAVASIISLLIMSYLSAYFLSVMLPNDLLQPDKFLGHDLFASIFPTLNTEQALPNWAWIPFAFTLYGATLGWLFELGLLVTGHAFEQQRTHFGQFIQSQRFVNLAPVTGSLFFAVCMLSIAPSSLQTGLLYLTLVGVGAMGTALLLGGAPWLAPLMIFTQIAQIGIVTFSALPNLIIGLLIGQAVLQTISLMLGALTPWRSTAFHLISTLSGALFFAALIYIANAGELSIIEQPAWPWNVLLGVGALVLGIGYAFKLQPQLYAKLRTVASNAVWSLQYFLLISAKRFPNPVALSDIYSEDNLPQEVGVKPYYLQHNKYLPEPLSIPAAERVEKNAKVFKAIFTTVKRAFKAIAFLDHNFPQVDTCIPLAQKPRLTVYSDGQDAFPFIYRHKYFGFSIPGQNLESTPEPAIEAYKKGQLLAYLAESGVANTLLKPGTTIGTLVMDLRFLESYETKADYEPYGGKAYFRINEVNQQLELISLIPPKSNESILVNANDPSFRHAERLLIASMYFQIISGKHLAEIHMTYNLVEVAMHNAFDAKKQWLHPVRTFMYLHFFSHELAEEMTTEHLVQERAVFNQVFATTHNSLIQHLNNSYHRFVYGTDEDFDQRLAMARMPSGELLPNSCLQWEYEYFKVFQNYTRSLINAIYLDDADVAQDANIQVFHQALEELLIQRLPERYEDFQTKAGLARWAADTIHHMVIRHQVYGTTGVKAAMDPRISDTQVPKDGGPAGVDEWRSLVGVALATARARFTLLTGPHKKDFTYLLEGIEEKYRQPMAAAFNQLQEDLYQLERLWQADDISKAYSYNYFRPVPSELHTGPGY
jgi:hypothetical protein